MHCNLRPLDTTPVLFRFNYDAMPSLKSLNLSNIAVFSVFAADTLLYAVTLTFDRAHVQCIACDVMKPSTKFGRSRSICSGAIAIFDLMTVNAT